MHLRLWHAHEIRTESKFISIYELAYFSYFVVSFDGCLWYTCLRHWLFSSTCFVFVNMAASTDIVAFTHLSKSPAKSQISIWSLSSQSKGVNALLFKLNYIVWYAYSFKNQGHKNSKLPIMKSHDLSHVLIERTWQQFALRIFTSDASQC